MMESSDRVSVSAVTALFLHHVFIHLILSYEALFAAQSELICSHQPTIALPGVDVILSCHLEPPISASSETVEWTRPGLDPEFVHVYKDGRLLHHIQNPSYNFRTRLFVDELEHGNVSMKIFSVKLSDEGTYRCFIPSVQKEASVQLLVGSVSTPVIEETSGESGAVVLECESKGWYPEPEVLWLDGEGNLLSAGPTETVRGPDDLYNVSSRVTVRRGDNFTCRVEQKIIKQVRETRIHITGDSIKNVTEVPALWIILPLVAFSVILILFVTYFMCKKREAKRNHLPSYDISAEHIGHLCLRCDASTQI